MTPSWVFFFVCLFFLLGIFVASFYSVSLVFLYMVTWLFLLATVLSFKKYPLIFMISLFVLFFILGIFRVARFNQKIEQSLLRSLVNKEVAITGIVSETPISQNKSVRFIFSADIVAGIGKIPKGEKITVIARPYPEVKFGDRLNLSCRIEAEPLFYSANSLKCLFPDVGIEKRNNLYSIRGLLESMRASFTNSISKVFPEPVAGFISGLLVGGTSGLSVEWREALVNTGTIHLVALSGFNITIIAGFLIIILDAIGFSRRLRLIMIGFVLTLFVLMVGAEASIVRAAIMGMLVVTARHLGRQSSPKNSIILAAVIMVFINPTVLLNDIGFQLSFLSTIGIIYLYPILEKWCQNYSNFLKFKEALLLTISAQVFVVPLLLYYFERLSLISPIVNMVVVGPIPIIMLFGFLAGLAGLFITPLGQIIGLGGWISASIVLKIIEYSARFPYASVDFSMPLWLVIIYYIFLGGGLFWYNRNKFFGRSKVGFSF